MEGIKIAVLVFILCGFQLYAVQCQNCKKENKLSGEIAVSTNVYTKHDCWTIPVPSGHFIYIQINSIETEHSCEEDYVSITTLGTIDKYKFCSSDGNRNPVIAFKDVTVIHYVSSSVSKVTKFSLEYTIKSSECLQNTSFKCDDKTCISEDKVCNGVRDCKDGADENGCVLPIEGVSAARAQAVSWLIEKRTSAWGWMDDTPRAIVALYLASDAFNGTNLEDELMAKQLELKTVVELQRPSLTDNDLSMFINALLVTCHSPRHFYGNNLVKRLKEQIKRSATSPHPLTYLALCNADEPWPPGASKNLNKILDSKSEYPFVKDLQAIALTALSCEEKRNRDSVNRNSYSMNRNRESDYVIQDTTQILYSNTIQHFKKLQAPDGSFGNVYTTALVTQALLSSDEHLIDSWNLNATIKYLMKELKSPSVNLLATYLILPILNERTLVDVSRVDCSANQRKHDDDMISEMNDLLGKKMRVQYSLFIGEEKEVVHTVSLLVPQNYTAFELMELAEVEKSKFKFEYKKTAGKVYVYEIANVTNDPESGKYWLLYVGAANRTDSLVHLLKGPEEVIMRDGDILVLWYKTATI